MLVLVVGGVAVVDAARVVAHTGDGHAVGVAEHRRHHCCLQCPVSRVCAVWGPSVH